MRSRFDRINSALLWVISTLEGRQVPYQAVGGLAAIAHGSTRPLNDIDLYAPLTEQPGLLGDLRPFTIWGPEHYTDEAWDLVFMKIDFDGVRIEIGDSSSSPKYFDRGRNAWVDHLISYDSSDVIEVFGVRVNVMPLPELLTYKRGLARDVDLQDLRELEVQLP